jgi:hypothetical protein
VYKLCNHEEPSVVGTCVPKVMQEVFNISSKGQSTARSRWNSFGRSTSSAAIPWTHRNFRVAVVQGRSSHFQLRHRESAVTFRNLIGQTS